MNDKIAISIVKKLVYILQNNYQKKISKSYKKYYSILICIQDLKAEKLQFF